jgi:hypothetical protein
MSGDNWQHSLPRSVWKLTRIIRSTRHALETLAVDADLLRVCAEDQQGLLIDRCDWQRAAGMLDAAAETMKCGVTWVFAGTDHGRRLLSGRAERLLRPRWVYEGHSSYPDALAWSGEGIRLLLTCAGDLRATSRYNLRQRRDTRDHFCPMVAIVDPDLNLCDRSCGGWDPAWLVRDAMSRICARQRVVPVVIFTARDVATINPSAVIKSFGLSGLMYLELPEGERCVRSI